VDDLGVTFFLAMVTALSFVVICFRLSLTVFDYFGIRSK
jgi:hypothetical protein